MSKSGIGELDAGFLGRGMEKTGEILFSECAIEEPNYYGKIAALVVLRLVSIVLDELGRVGLLWGGSLCICPSAPYLDLIYQSKRA